MYILQARACCIFEKGKRQDQQLVEVLGHFCRPTEVQNIVLQNSKYYLRQKNLYSFIISAFIGVKNEYKSIVGPSILSVSPLWLIHGRNLSGKRFLELFEIFGVMALPTILTIFLISYLRYI